MATAMNKAPGLCSVAGLATDPMSQVIAQTSAIPTMDLVALLNDGKLTPIVRMIAISPQDNVC